ncbi:hypothetical protein, partial [Aquisphaera insulae]|uniref:hypothetical protein n=1 Tax=Aquisphaera insulae TaxID=2712864 RepID=UPI0013EA0775
GDAREAGSQWRAVLTECPGDAEALWGVHRLDGPIEPSSVPWLVEGSTRAVVPMAGPGDFDPYLDLARRWVR